MIIFENLSISAKVKLYQFLKIWKIARITMEHFGSQKNHSRISEFSCWHLIDISKISFNFCFDKCQKI
jgi:hypothetical protein